MDQPPPDALPEFRRLGDEYRHPCLWFLREDYYPATDVEAYRALDALQRHGDRESLPPCGEAPPTALTPFQRDVCRLLAETRIRSYVAGAAALNEILQAPRRSRDIDLFRDRGGTRDVLER